MEVVVAVMDGAGEVNADSREQQASAGPSLGSSGIGRAEPTVPALGNGNAARALVAVQARYEQLHEAIGRADLKASVVATVEAAAIAAVLGALAQRQTAPPNRGLLLVGLVALLVGLGFAGAAVFPRLGVRSMRRSRAHAQNSLNIRQLHARDPNELARHLVAQSDRDRLEELAQQIVWLAQIVWTKNMWLQRSLLAAAAAVLVLVAAYLA
jgi:hypothetical protein